ncbi:hypothetical protein CLU96_2356 [Chryseobacterium sp. 52]|uniref:hypothetical protein n=1 Tax=Chryseobacterium sp. 52 TaxID=2035213 RepID=UPI000C18ECDA|nr:hypothetical protein [Chryseobacterium sp. 52]PIF45354.1 hypothetical protein CLU96_2356 [Chryseobacterium sp. 52]
MQLFPLTPVGVEDKLNELYSLPEADVLVQAEAIRLDFKNWMKDSFILSNNQMLFLEGINDAVALYYGQQCSFCFIHTLDIRLIYPDPPENLRYAKWTGLANDLEVKGNGMGETDISGTLTFTMSYV